jgi:hypothetical protein
MPFSDVPLRLPEPGTVPPVFRLAAAVDSVSGGHAPVVVVNLFVEFFAVVGGFRFDYS